MSNIGTLSEKSLHAALKLWYSQADDKFEVKVENFVIDIVRNNLLIEIQTGNFGAMKPKLKRLLPNYHIHLIYPIAQQKWIVRQTKEGDLIKRRKSPKRGSVIDVFKELVRIAEFMSNSNLSLEVLLIHQEEIWRDDGKGSWRRKKWSVYDHHLLRVVEQLSFKSPSDFCELLPKNLAQPFTNRQLATALACTVNMAQRMSYSLRKMGELTVVGKKGNALLYKLTK